MSEENVELQENNTEIQVEQVVEHTPVELKAMEMGWRPKTEFNGDEADFIDAKEFVARKPLFDKIEHQSKQLKQLAKGLHEFKDHYNKLEETAIRKAKLELENLRTQAVTDADGDTFSRVDTQLKQLDTQLKQLDQRRTQVAEEVIAPEFVEWQAKNTWYAKDQEMRAFADEYGITLHKRGLSPDQVLRRVEDMVRKEFPSKFTNPKKETAPTMETANNTNAAKGRKEPDVQLTDTERKIMNDFLRMKNPDGTPFMTKDQYLADLRKVKGVA